MTEKIRLKVPSAPAAEFVSQGYLRADLQPDGVVETDSRQFADYLIGEFGLAEIGEPQRSDSSSSEPSLKERLEAEYPPDFPRRDVFIEMEMPLATVRGLTREQLVDLNGIAEKTADKVLAFLAEPVETMPETNVDGGEK